MKIEQAMNSRFELAVFNDQIIYEKKPSDIRKVEQMVGLPPRELHTADRSGELDIKMHGLFLEGFQLVNVFTTNGFIERYPRYESLFIALPIAGTLECITERKHLLAAPMQAIVLSPSNSCTFNWARNSQIVLLHFRAELLQELVDDLPNDLGGLLLRFEDVFNLNNSKYSNLLKIIQAFSQEVMDDPERMRESRVIKPWLMVMLTSLARLHLNKNKRSPKASFELSPYYVKRAINYIHDHLNGELTRDHIVSASGVAQRSLHNSFKKCYGVGPMTYYRNARLGHAHDELLKSTPCEISVNEVAHKWGFHNQSRFAASYRKLFGELPSETLNKARL